MNKPKDKDVTFRILVQKIGTIPGVLELIVLISILWLTK